MPPLYFACSMNTTRRMGKRFAQLIQISPVYHKLGSTHEVAFSFEGLATLSRKTPYSQYRRYVLENGILTLFADQNKEYPFPYSFKGVINPGDYFTIPDENAVVYLNNNREGQFTQEKLVCFFNVEFPSGSELIVVSDFCLRLIVNINSQLGYTTVKVWTNIPIGTYLLSNNAAVELSNDNVTWSRGTLLKSDYLYIKGILNNASLGDNVFNVSLCMYNCEILNVPSL